VTTFLIGMQIKIFAAFLCYNNTIYSLRVSQCEILILGTFCEWQHLCQIFTLNCIKTSDHIQTNSMISFGLCLFCLMLWCWLISYCQTLIASTFCECVMAFWLSHAHWRPHLHQVTLVLKTLFGVLFKNRTVEFRLHMFDFDG